MGKLLFHLLQKRDGTEYLSDRCRMNPNRPFEGWVLKKSHSLGQCLSKPLLDETPQKKVGSRNDEKTSQDDIVKKINH
jgi:hypothetical protein